MLLSELSAEDVRGIRVLRGPLDCCWDFLQKEYNAIEEDDVDRFKRARAKLITAVNKRITEPRDHLCSHDAILCSTLKGWNTFLCIILLTTNRVR